MAIFNSYVKLPEGIENIIQIRWYFQFYQDQAGKTHNETMIGNDRVKGCCPVPPTPDTGLPVPNVAFWNLKRKQSKPARTVL